MPRDTKEENNVYLDTISWQVIYLIWFFKYLCIFLFENDEEEGALQT